MQAFSRLDGVFGELFDYHSQVFLANLNNYFKLHICLSIRVSTLLSFCVTENQLQFLQLYQKILQIEVSWYGFRVKNMDLQSCLGPWIPLGKEKMESNIVFLSEAKKTYVYKNSVAWYAYKQKVCIMGHSLCVSLPPQYWYGTVVCISTLKIYSKVIFSKFLYILNSLLSINLFSKLKCIKN